MLSFALWLSSVLAYLFPYIQYCPVLMKTVLLMLDLGVSTYLHVVKASLRKANTIPRNFKVPRKLLGYTHIDLRSSCANVHFGKKCWKQKAQAKKLESRGNRAQFQILWSFSPHDPGWEKRGVLKTMSCSKTLLYKLLEQISQHWAESMKCCIWIVYPAGLGVGLLQLFRSLFQQKSWI